MTEADPTERLEAFDPGTAQFLLVGVQLLVGLAAVAGAIVSDLCAGLVLGTFGVALLATAGWLLSRQPAAYMAAAALNGTFGAMLLAGMVIFRQREMDLGYGQVRPVATSVVYWGALAALPFLAYCTTTAVTLHRRAKRQAETPAAPPPVSLDAEEFPATPGWDETTTSAPRDRRD